MSDDRNVTITGLPLLQFMMSDRTKYSAKRAMRQCLETGNLTTQQRSQRSNIRNAYLVEDISVIEAGKERQDAFGKLCLQEMIDQCEEENVTNFGRTASFPQDTGK